MTFFATSLRQRCGSVLCQSIKTDVRIGCFDLDQICDPISVGSLYSSAVYQNHTRKNMVCFHVGANAGLFCEFIIQFRLLWFWSKAHFIRVKLFFIEQKTILNFEQTSIYLLLYFDKQTSIYLLLSLSYQCNIAFFKWEFSVKWDLLSVDGGSQRDCGHSGPYICPWKHCSKLIFSFTSINKTYSQ